MAGYTIVAARSTVWIEARSSVHPIHGEATGLTGHLRLDVKDGRLDLSAPTELHVELPVELLRSGNPLYDREMHRRIEARRYPAITGTARHVVALGPVDRYGVRGDVSFHGVSRTVEGEVQLDAPDEATVIITGERVFDIREFDLEPPRLLMLKVYPDVRVRVRVIAERDG
jgi:polyisoprenoid-binding protein YceI